MASDKKTDAPIRTTSDPPPTNGASEFADIPPPSQDGLNSQSLPFIEDLYAHYLENPQGVPADWRGYFDRIRDPGEGRFRPPAEVVFPRHSLFHPRTGDGAQPASAVFGEALLQERVDRLIHAYRVRGHIAAH